MSVSVIDWELKVKCVAIYKVKLFAENVPYIVLYSYNFVNAAQPDQW